MSIYATLRTTPINVGHSHEMIYITRGASAELTYTLFDKVFKIEDVEQITFTFRQGKSLYWYSMFNQVENEGVIETVVDPHFYIFENEDYGAVIFNLDNEETKQFKPNINLEFEVAIKLNTDSFATLSNKDSIIIEPQHPIAVVDSLYSQL